MSQSVTVFEAAALADCRRDGTGGYRAGTFAEITSRHGVELDRLCELWDAERRRRPAVPSNVIQMKEAR
ncbi:MAG TPA: hypothetical protein VL202_00355 [Pararhizobium sp.]|uniref:hypothetical protein n=1 Tax=Pararhizobium sp. TaxID=1977563 RepID=UPI002BA10B4F|nr:hypothetical protein [Pararhizobium sp.]HTO29621.1 hypothetical protein [Pararhizobium sp.]